jgi:hypothetical protein
MSEYTPTMEQIRYGWAVFSNWKRVPTCGRVQAEKDFDDWLKAHDAGIRNAALEEAAEAERCDMEYVGTPDGNSGYEMCAHEIELITRTAIRSTDPKEATL